MSWTEFGVLNVAGGTAGVLAWGSVYPFDVIKSRLQVNSKEKELHDDDDDDDDDDDERNNKLVYYYLPHQRKSYYKIIYFLSHRS